MTEDQQFTQDLLQAKQYTEMLIKTYNSIYSYTEERMKMDTSEHLRN